MTPEQKLKTLGFKDMHDDQIEALMQLVEAALSLAGAVGEAEFEEMHSVAEDAVIMFGGVGIDVRFKADY